MTANARRAGNPAGAVFHRCTLQVKPHHCEEDNRITVRQCLECHVATTACARAAPQYRGKP